MHGDGKGASWGPDANTVVDASGSKIDITMKTLFAFAIVFIVAGHVIVGPAAAGISFAYNMFPPASFHVACFVFVAGYFYKPRYERDPLTFFKKRAMRLLVPLYAINALYGLWTLAAHRIGFSFGEDPTLYNLLLDPLFGGHAFRWDLCLWFVAPLLATEFVDFTLRLVLRVGESRAKELLLAALYAACGLAVTTLCGADGFAEYSSAPLVLAARVGFFLPCYAMGRIYRVFLVYHDSAPNWLYFSIVIGAQILLLVACRGQITYVISWCWFLCGPIVPFLATATGIAFWLRLSRIVSVGLVESRAMHLVADNTFSIMAHQFVGIFAVKGLFALAAAAGLCPGFDMAAFFGDFWYYYVPDLPAGAAIAFGAVYVAGGLGVPLAMHSLWQRVRRGACGSGLCV